MATQSHVQEMFKMRAHGLVSVDDVVIFSGNSANLQRALDAATAASGLRSVRQKQLSCVWTWADAWRQAAIPVGRSNCATSKEECLPG